MNFYEEVAKQLKNPSEVENFHQMLDKICQPTTKRHTLQGTAAKVRCDEQRRHKIGGLKLMIQDVDVFERKIGDLERYGMKRQNMFYYSDKGEGFWMHQEDYN